MLYEFVYFERMSLLTVCLWYMVYVYQVNTYKARKSYGKNMCEDKQIAKPRDIWAIELGYGRALLYTFHMMFPIV